jgi:transcription antitermination factor NusA-like protein
MIRIEHNVETGEVKEIELTAEEIADALARQEAAKPKAAAIEAKKLEEEQKAAEKIALFTKLGITEDEAKLLLS